MATLPKLPGIPSISPVQDTTIAAILRPMKESLEILGGAISGNPLPNGTVVDAGLNPAISNNLTISNVYDGTTDTTIPPTAAGLTISAGFTNILLSWTDPNSSGAFLNYAYTEVWRSVDNVLANAVLQGFAPGAVYSDPVGTSKTYYYWIRFVSQANITGPYNSSVGTIGGTGLVGGVDLGPLIIDASKLATSAVEASKIANLAVGNAAIANLAVTNGKIANLAVDDAKIANLAVSKLTAGSVSVGQYIQSTGYSAGTNGWHINGNGFAEFGSASIRGQLTASQIDTRGLTIKDSSGTVIFAAGTNLAYTYINADPGWLNSALTPSITNAQNTADSAVSGLTAKLTKAGDTISGRITFSVADGMFAGSNTSNGVYFGSTGLIGRKAGVNTFYIDTAGNAVFAGSLSAATGSFTGSLSAASGTFSGTLTAAAINAVDTINIANNAVTVPASNVAAANGATVTINVTAAAAGQPVTLIITWYYVQISWFRAKIYRNGTEIYNNLVSRSSGGVNPYMPITISGIDYPPQGNNVYTVSSSYDDGNTVVPETTALFALLSKR